MFPLTLFFSFLNPFCLPHAYLCRQLGAFIDILGYWFSGMLHPQNHTYEHITVLIVAKACAGIQHTRERRSNLGNKF